MSNSPTSLGPDATAARVAWRREALRRAGVSQVQLAARAGVSRQSVGLVLAGHHRSRHVEEAIAEACGMTREELFAEGDPRPADLPAAAAGEPRALDAIARGDGPQVVAAPAVTDAALEERLTAELRRIAEELFLAMAAGSIAADRPVVRAAAAAVGELAGRLRSG